MRDAIKNLGSDPDKINPLVSSVFFLLLDLSGYPLPYLSLGDI